MSINCLSRYLIAVLLFAGLPLGTFATDANYTDVNSTVNLYQDKRGSKQDRGKGSKGGKDHKKPQVKEVPQSRKQQKPSQVKQDKKEKSNKDNKRRN